MQKAKFSILIGLFWVSCIARTQGLPKDSAYVEALAAYATSEEWLSLIYYDRHGSTFSSRVSSESYFLSGQEGQKNPALELRTSVEIFKEIRPESPVHPQCILPFRYKVLRRHFNLAPAVACQKLEGWIQSTQPSEIKFVYASQYVSNPASVFGHAFILLPSSRLVKSLWFTFNYAAEVPKGDNAIEYIFKGLGGGYNGDYSVLPYYQRLFQYGHIENRDLWVYSIKLSEDELDSFIKHLWELVHLADFSYYFLDENCAGILMRSFAAILPDLRSARNLPIYVHPLEVIKYLDRHDRRGEVALIPSQFNAVVIHLDSLTPQQRSEFYQAIEYSESHKLSNDPQLAEAIMEYTSYRTQINFGKLPKNLSPLERQAHLIRSQFDIPVLDTTPKGSQNYAPHLAHEAWATSLGAANTNGIPNVNLAFRYGIHNLLDPEPGFLTNSTLEFMKLQIATQSGKVWIKDWTIVRAENFQNIKRFDPKSSWRISLNLQENLFTDTPYDHYLSLSSGYGATASLGSQAVYGMITGQNDFGQDLPQGHLRLGAETGYILRAKKLKGLFSASLSDAYFENSDKLKLAQLIAALRWSLTRNWALLHETKWQRLIDKNIGGQDYIFKVQYYF